MLYFIQTQYTSLQGCLNQSLLFFGSFFWGEKCNQSKVGIVAFQIVICLLDLHVQIYFVAPVVFKLSSGVYYEKRAYISAK